MTGQDSSKPDEFEPTDNGHGPVRADIEFPSEPISGPLPAAFHADSAPSIEADDSPADDDDRRPSMDTKKGQNDRIPQESGPRGRNNKRRPAHGPGSRRSKPRPARQKAGLSTALTAIDGDPGESPARLSHEYAFMEALAVVAAKTRKASSAGQLAAAMVPLAMQSVSRYQAELQPVVPVLVWGAAGVAELMHAEETPVLIGLMPAILDQTAQHLGSLVALGQPVDRQVATDVLAEFTSLIIEQNYGNDRGPQRAEQAQWNGEDEYDSR
jgi:hypothetical protein